MPDRAEEGSKLDWEDRCCVEVWVGWGQRAASRVGKWSPLNGELLLQVWGWFRFEWRDFATHPRNTHVLPAEPRGLGGARIFLVSFFVFGKKGRETRFMFTGGKASAAGSWMVMCISRVDVSFSCLFLLKNHGRRAGRCCRKGAKKGINRFLTLVSFCRKLAFQMR